MGPIIIMSLGLVSLDISIPAGVRLIVVLPVVVWPVVSDMPIYYGFLDVYMFCMLHVLYIWYHSCCPYISRHPDSLARENCASNACAYGKGWPWTKVSLGQTFLYPSMTCGRPPLKRPHSCFRGGCPQGRRPMAVFYPLGHPTPSASVHHRFCFPLSAAGVRR
jgi:hypothetical protein